MINVEIIADSTNKEGNRLTTFKLEYPRYIHSELLTHRVFSRNSSSSRAIPVETMIQKTIDNPVEPIFMANQKGMQADFKLKPYQEEGAIAIWEKAHLQAIESAKLLIKQGVHKQIANRLLEPFSHIAVVLSGTEFENFFKLRCHPSAQQEIQVLATEMQRCYNKYEPNFVDYGQYHLPFITNKEKDLTESEKIMVSVARCARVSYYNFEGKNSLEDDARLFNLLVNSGHMSPLEHIANPSLYKPFWANFKGWKQLRRNYE